MTFSLEDVCLVYLGICCLIFIGVMTFGIYDDWEGTYKTLGTPPNMITFDFYLFALLISVPIINLLVLAWSVIVGCAILYEVIRRRTTRPFRRSR